MKEIIHIDTLSKVPIYKQIIRSVRTAVGEGMLKTGQRLPSINTIRGRYFISRDTIIKAYQELMATGVVSSSPGKGYYITSVNIERQYHIFLLFDEFSAYKEILYHSIKGRFQKKATIDLYFHHFDQKIYKSLIEESIGKFSDYVVIPLTDPDSVKCLSRHLGNSNLYILDQGSKVLGKKYTSVCQYFDRDCYRAMKSVVDLLGKYRQIILVLGETDDPSKQNIVKDIRRGFEKFKSETGYRCEVTSNFEKRMPGCSECYILQSDDDLVELIQRIRSSTLKLGEDIGIISFNDTPLKQVVADGIAVISTDYQAMGKKMVDLILHQSKVHIKNPSSLIVRPSL